MTSPEWEALLTRACGILNPFLDKYRLLNQDYRVSRVSTDTNFYLAAFHTSPLASGEVSMTPEELFERLEREGRHFTAELGRGASNLLRSNSYELLGPRSGLSQEGQTVFEAFIREPYKMPLSYDLIMQALSCLQKTRDYRLAIVHAQSAFEVYVVDQLLRLMLDSGTSEASAAALMESKDYWGVKKKIERLEDWTERYCKNNGLSFLPFYKTSLYQRWDSQLYKKRNRAVHTGASAFSYDEASIAIGIAKECMFTLDSRVPTLCDRVALDPSMTSFRLSAGEVGF